MKRVSWLLMYCRDLMPISSKDFSESLADNSAWISGDNARLCRLFSRILHHSRRLQCRSTQDWFFSRFRVPVFYRCVYLLSYGSSFGSYHRIVPVGDFVLTSRSRRFKVIKISLRPNDYIWFKATARILFIWNDDYMSSLDFHFLVD